MHTGLEKHKGYSLYGAVVAKWLESWTGIRKVTGQILSRKMTEVPLSKAPNPKSLPAWEPQEK